ncbi:MAG TPA: ribosomal protein S18-alanine N-acetyltransferase [Thermoanaerobacterales bacterium]|nr:ribosomal protein S18-alanine N-acetyltransferase [Thermoanaerobacterales bacterium]
MNCNLVDNIFIEKMKLIDIRKALEIEAHSFTTPWTHYAFLTELRDNSFADYFVAKIKLSDGEYILIGYIGMWGIMDEAHITTFAVHEEYRCKGVGRKLLEHAIKASIDKGIVNMTLEVRKSNEPAKHLYEKLGFEVRGIRKKYYSDDNEDALIMWKENLKNDI